MKRQKATSNFLSRDASKAFEKFPKGFPHDNLNTVKNMKNRSDFFEKRSPNQITKQQYLQNPVTKARCQQTSITKQQESKILWNKDRIV